MIFVLTLAAGICFGGSEAISERISNYLHHDCARWDEQTLARPLFTLKEVHLLLGKKVHLKNSKFHPDNVGRTRMIQMVGQDKFLLVIDWKIDPQLGKETLMFHDKDILPNLEFDN